jgi:hypothetical protein
MAALVHEWDAWGVSYRLVFIPGKNVKDKYQVEQRGPDTLGDDRWDAIFTWDVEDPGKRTQHMILCSALESLVRANPVLDAAWRTGGWDAVSVILRKKDA